MNRYPKCYLAAYNIFFLDSKPFPQLMLTITLILRPWKPRRTAGSTRRLCQWPWRPRARRAVWSVFFRQKTWIDGKLRWVRLQCVVLYIVYQYFVVAFFGGVWRLTILAVPQGDKKCKPWWYDWYDFPSGHGFEASIHWKCLKSLSCLVRSILVPSVAVAQWEGW